jgi:hypothetical protein
VDFLLLRRGSGEVNSGYACGGLVPMWESGVGRWIVWRIG